MDATLGLHNGSSLATNYNEIDNMSELNLTTTYPQPTMHPIITFLEVYSIPALCLLGITGNTLASFVFLQKPLSNSSCGVFLATRGFSDNGFLSTLLIIWISRTFELQLGAVRGTCRIIIFLSYVCGCISVWLVVFVTIENYIRICRPFIVNRVCNTFTAKLAVLFLCIISVVLYNFPFWAMDAEGCRPLPDYFNIVQALVYTDTVITLVIPLISITVLLTAIVCSLVKYYNRRSKIRTPSAKKTKNPRAKVTKMLFAVSVSFFCLNLPSHISRLRVQITGFIDENRYPTELDHVIQQITLVISYLSLTINIFVYLTFGSKFRQVFKEVIFCKATGSKTASPDRLTSARARQEHSMTLADTNNVVSATHAEKVPLHNGDPV